MTEVSLGLGQVLALLDSLIGSGRHAEALAIADQVGAQIPHDPYPPLWAAKALLGLGRPDDARDRVVTAVERAPDRADLRLHLAQVESIGGHAMGAANAAIEAIRRDHGLRAAHELFFSTMLGQPPQAAAPALKGWAEATLPGARPATAIGALARHFGSLGDSYELFVSAAHLCGTAGEWEAAAQAFHACQVSVADASAPAPAAEVVAARYAKGGAGYDDNVVHRATVEAFLRVALARLGERRGLTIIDAACGSGLAGPALRPLAGRLTGIDLSDAMCATARSLGVYDEVITGDMVATLAAMPATADAVTCSGATYYLDDLAPFLDAARAALRPGGLLVFTDFPAPDGAGTLVTKGGTRRHCRAPDLVRAQAARAGLAERGAEYVFCFNLPAICWAFAAPA